MRLTAILLALCAATAVTASPTYERTETVTKPTNEGIVSTVAGLTRPADIRNIGQGTQTTTTTTTSRHRKVRRHGSSNSQPSMNLAHLSSLAFQALQKEGMKTGGVVYKAAKQTDQDLGIDEKPTTPQQATQPPSLPNQTPNVATGTPPSSPNQAPNVATGTPPSSPDQSSNIATGTPPSSPNQSPKVTTVTPPSSGPNDDDETT